MEDTCVILAIFTEYCDFICESHFSTAMKEKRAERVKEDERERKRKPEGREQKRNGDNGGKKIPGPGPPRCHRGHHIVLKTGVQISVFT